MQELMAICVVGIITWGVFRLFELFARRKERLTLIEKLGINTSNPDFLNQEFYLPLFNKKTNTSFWPLRISLLMIGIGLGLLVGFFIQDAVIGYITKDINYDSGFRNDVGHGMEVVYFASVALFGGMGLFIAYMIERKQVKDKD